MVNTAFDRNPYTCLDERGLASAKPRHALSRFWRMLTALCAMFAVVEAVAAGTVFNAGEALRANVAGAASNPCTVSGGTWSWLDVDVAGGTETLAATPGSATRIAGRGFSSAGGVEFAANTGDAAVYLDGDAAVFPQPFETDEIYVAPANGRAGVVRFVVAEDGWYSATAEFKGLDGGDAYGYVFVGGVDCAAGRFSLQNKNFFSKVFCAQVAPRHLAAGTAIDFKVVPTGAHAKEMSAVRAIVRKEVPGAFYDLGTALVESVNRSFVNPLQDAQGGFWGFYYRPNNGRVYKMGTAAQSYGKGFVYDTYQQFLVNAEATNNLVLGVNPWEKNRPGELDVHPKATTWEDGTPVQAFARFFPPKPGYYSGTLALRGVATASGMDGAYGHVCVGGNREIAKVFYCAAGQGAQSGMVHFGPVYLMAGEPLDFFVDPGPAGYNGMDRALGSLVLRREEDYVEPGQTVYDANVALHDNIDAGNKPVSNPRVLADGARWEWGYSTGLADALTLFTAAQTGSNNGCYGYSDTANSFYNQILVRTANTMWITLLSNNPVLLPVVPYMFNAHPAEKAKTVVRFTPSRDGRYTVKMRGRAFAAGNNDHVNFFTVVNGRLLGKISDRQAYYDNVKAYPNQDIPTLVFEDVDLHAGDDVRLVIDPNVNQGGDRCGGSFAVIREGDIPGPGTNGVVNFACFTPGDAVRVSAFAERGRVKSGTTWNAYPVCTNATSALESDGATKRNAWFTFSTTNDTASAVGGSPSAASAQALYNGWIRAAAGESVDFVFGRLVPGNRYTLCLYSARGRDAGNAVFTVGGESRTVNCTVVATTTRVPVYNERLWFDSPFNSYVVFEDVEADANGEIRGQFSCAAGADEAAFNGAQISGVFPPYVAAGTLLVVR